MLEIVPARLEGVARALVVAAAAASVLTARPCAAAPAARAAATPAAATAPAPASADTLIAKILAERVETEAFFKDGDTSPFATVDRKDLPREGWLTVGRAADNNLVLDDSTLAAHELRLEVKDGGFALEKLDPDSKLMLDGNPVTGTLTVPPRAIALGRYRLRLSYQNAPAVIVFDPQCPRRHVFAGLAYFPVDLRFRFVVQLDPGARPETVLVESTHGAPRRALRAGRFAFTVGGRKQRLAAYRLLEPGVDPDGLAIFFRDATTGRESYEGGRYLEVEHLPDGRYVLDFNRAYNPYCAYSPHFNCPIPPAENRLAVSIRAGEAWHGHAP